MMKSAVALLISLLPLIASAKTVLVSDIDDTIKISHVRDRGDMVARAFETGIVFKGMAPLYQFLARQTQAPVFYVTNAPAFLMESAHTELLQNGGFPKGELLLQAEVSKDENKIFHIRRIIARTKPDRLILIGDNGERDPEIYDQVRRENPKIQVLTFIRTLYSCANGSDVGGLRKDQQGFVSPADILTVLAAKNVLPKEDAAKMAAAQRARFASEAFAGEGAGYRTDWMDFAEFAPTSEMLSDTSPVALKYRQAIKAQSSRARCRKPASGPHS